jgi:hypothetical protein
LPIDDCNHWPSPLWHWALWPPAQAFHLTNWAAVKLSSAGLLGSTFFYGVNAGEKVQV